MFYIFVALFWGYRPVHAEARPDSWSMCFSTSAHALYEHAQHPYDYTKLQTDDNKHGGDHTPLDRGDGGCVCWAVAATRNKNSDRVELFLWNSNSSGLDMFNFRVNVFTWAPEVCSWELVLDENITKTVQCMPGFRGDTLIYWLPYKKHINSNNTQLYLQSVACYICCQTEWVQLEEHAGEFTLWPLTSRRPAASARQQKQRRRCNSHCG